MVAEAGQLIFTVALVAEVSVPRDNILAAVEPAADPGEIGEKMATLALQHICPIDDVRASAEYRRDMTAVLCRRLAVRLLVPAGRAS